jgi:hypothetical protein
MYFKGNDYICVIDFVQFQTKDFLGVIKDEL